MVSELLVLFSMVVKEFRDKGKILCPLLELEKIYIGENLKCIQVYFGEFNEVIFPDIASSR